MCRHKGIDSHKVSQNGVTVNEPGRTGAIAAAAYRSSRDAVSVKPAIARSSGEVVNKDCRNCERCHDPNQEQPELEQRGFADAKFLDSYIP